VYDVMMAPPDADLAGVLKGATVPTSAENVDLIPATLNLAGAEVSLATAIARETKLRRGLEPAQRLYDVILLDTGPSLGLLTINALAAAESVLVPIQCEYYALEGLSQLLDVVHLVQGQINPGLSIEGIVLTMYDGRTSLSRQVAKEVRRHFRGRVFTVTIPRNVRLAEAPSHGVPGILYDSQSRGARAYVNLAREVF
jgi:chromosome partitioning protein